MDDYKLMLVGIIAFVVFGISAIVWLFVRSRKREGIGILEMTAKDKAQLQELRHDFNIWRFCSRILGGIGCISLIAGFMSFVEIDKNGRADWRGGILCFVVGAILILPAFLVARRDRHSK